MAHAEMNALARRAVGTYDGHTLFTTFEPCVMCVGTIRIYRIPRGQLRSRRSGVGRSARDARGHGVDGVPAARSAATLGGPLRCVRACSGTWTFLVGNAPEFVIGVHRRESAARQLELPSSLAEREHLRALADDGATTLRGCGIDLARAARRLRHGPAVRIERHVSEGPSGHGYRGARRPSTSGGRARSAQVCVYSERRRSNPPRKLSGTRTVGVRHLWRVGSERLWLR